MLIVDGIGFRGLDQHSDAVRVFVVDGLLEQTAFLFKLMESFLVLLILHQLLLQVLVLLEEALALVLVLGEEPLVVPEEIEFVF